MPSQRTEVTEIVTGLAMLGRGDLDWALESRPKQLVGVDDVVWDRLVQARASGEFEGDFRRAWENGLAFLAAEDGLRYRVPGRIEWKGPDRLPLKTDVPADLRIDRVFMVSCKYMSKVLHNLAPAGLFDPEHSSSSVSAKGLDWFDVVAPSEYQAFYLAAREALDDDELPSAVAELCRDDRTKLKAAFKRNLPDSTAAPYEDFVAAVAARSADRWRACLGERRQREWLLWRLLRLGGAPYFVLGSARGSSPVMRLRVETAWDWLQMYRLRAFEIWPEPAGQPVVSWQASVEERATGATKTVRGHVEIRWSHGRFSGNPEAKVYLDTSHLEVPGYEQLR